VRAELIWDNGPLNTSGVALSIGWNQSVPTPYRYALTDDFVLTSPGVLSKLTTYGFMQGNNVNQPQVIAMYVRILADNAGQPGTPILGGFASGLPFTETYTGSNYLGQASAPIYWLEATLPDWRLCPGRYWIQYNVDQSDIRPSTGGSDASFFSTLVQPAPPSPTGWHYSVLQSQYFSLQKTARRSRSRARYGPHAPTRATSMATETARPPTFRASSPPSSPRSSSRAGISMATARSMAAIFPGFSNACWIDSHSEGLAEDVSGLAPHGPARASSALPTSTVEFGMFSLCSHLPDCRTDIVSSRSFAFVDLLT